MIRTNTILSSGAALIATLIAAPALALTYDYSIDFEDMTHGQVLGSHDYSQVELLYVHNKQQDFDRICQRLQVEASLGHAKPSSRGSYRDYYDADSEALVRQAFAEDIALFDYQF